MTDNPLAFPRPGFDNPAGYEDGMTLLDWFAGQALAGFLSSPLLGDLGRQKIAGEAYAIADAMLAHRKSLQRGLA